MKLQEIKEIARDMKIAHSGMRKSELIRAVQRGEGNAQCFDTGNAGKCGQDRCAWRDDCK
jgi:hypothetical protein